MAPMKNSLAPSVVRHDGKKGRKCFGILETVYDNANMTEEEAQRVNEAPGLADLFGRFIAENRLPKLYADEECKSGYTYPYDGPVCQHNILRLNSWVGRDGT
jgi:hypothetical protein